MQTDWIQIKRLFNESATFGKVLKTLIPLLEKIEIKGKNHPLGFYSFLLCQLNEKENIRLHIWNNHDSLQDTNLLIHNHLFNFKSLVLFGAVSNCRYKISNEDLKSRGILYSVNYREGKSVLKKMKSNISISPPTVETVNQGQYYGVENHEFHKSEADSSVYTATILITTKVTDEAPLVFSSKDYGNEMSYERSELPLANHELIIQNLITRLKQVQDSKNKQN